MEMYWNLASCFFHLIILFSFEILVVNLVFQENLKEGSHIVVFTPPQIHGYYSDDITHYNTNIYIRQPIS